MSKIARLTAVLALLSTNAIGQSAPPGDASENFPRPPEIVDAVAFWTRVYTEIDTNSGFVHDNRHLDVVYTTVELRENASPRQRRRASRDAIDRYRKILNDLARGDDGAMTTEVARVRALWPADTTRAEFREAAGRLRFQLGQANRYRDGLIRSGRWRDHIVDVFTSRGLPAELSALPHVESSFDPTAYSKVGAAGMWQFTRSTGLRYMQIDHIVDQRRDPYMATEAAARLLADNYAVIESWPLALTAYNHGLAGMRRAASRLGTKNIGTIVEQYSSRTFGFASRNFYAAFLAALDVDSDPERFFGPLTLDSKDTTTVLELEDYIDAGPLADALGISLGELRELNPALMDNVWAGEKFVPRGFPVRLPAHLTADAANRIDAIPGALRSAQQRPDVQHRVRRGETLSGIADRYRISLASLVRANGLSNRNFIREGQVLNLPAAAGAGLPAPATIDAVAARTSGEYVVQRGDSIDRIARSLSVDQAELLATNQIANRNRIYPGQVLALPGQPSGAAESAPETVENPAATLPGTTLAALPADQGELPSRADTPALAADDVREIVAAEVAEATEQPVSSIDANVLASTQATLASDPSDYSVGPDRTIAVQAMETLGHYADWLEIRTQRLRDINGLPFGQAVDYGQRIALDFSQVDIATFEARRQHFQAQRQESFFSNYVVDEIVEHVVRPGESLWLLALRRYEVPVWLLRQYNPDVDLDRIQPGAVVKFPRLRSIASQASGNDGGRTVG